MIVPPVSTSQDGDTSLLASARPRCDQFSSGESFTLERWNEVVGSTARMCPDISDGREKDNVRTIIFWDAVSVNTVNRAAKRSFATDTLVVTENQSLFGDVPVMVRLLAFVQDVNAAIVASDGCK